MSLLKFSNRVPNRELQKHLQYHANMASMMHDGPTYDISSLYIALLFFTTNLQHNYSLYQIIYKVKKK